MAEPKTLYSEQAEAVDLLLADDPRRWRVVVMPTGAGKTAVLQTAATLAAQAGKRVVIGTPLQTIRSAIRAQDAFVYAGRVVDMASVSWHATRSGAALSALLTDWQGSRTGVVVATQQSLVQCAGGFPQDMRGWVVVLDEAHHAGETYDLDDGPDGTHLYRLARLCYERGGQVWSVTATAFRSDGRRIATSDVASYLVRYSDLALKDLLPRNVRVRAVVCPEATDLILSDATLASIAAYTREVGRPTVLRLPPGSANSEPATVTAERMVGALVAAGCEGERILNAVGSGIEVADRLQGALDAERARAAEGYAARQYDVIVACGRMREGADWPYCSHVVMVGIPSSLTAAVQTAGRASRNKRRIPGYPTPWVEDVLVSAFIPGDEIEVVAQAQRALLLAAAIECDETTIDYRRFWIGLTKGFRLPPTVRGARTSDALARIGGSFEDQAVATATVLTARHDLAASLGRDPTPVELWTRLDQWGSTADRRARRSLLAQAVVRDVADPELRTAFGRAYLGALEAAQDAPDLDTWDDTFEDTLASAFLRLAAEHAHLSVASRVSDLSVVEAGLSPAVLRAATAALAAERNAALAYSDEEIVRALPDPKSFPHVGKDAPLTQYFGRRTFATDLRNHLRRTDFDLDRLRLCVLWHAQKKCEHPVVGEPLDPAQVRAALEKLHKGRRGVFRRLPEVGRSAREAEIAVDKATRDFQIRIGGKPESLIGLWWGAQRGWRGLTRDVFAGLVE